MKQLLLVLGWFAATLGNAWAHDDHQPKRGGIVGESDEATIELVLEAGMLALYVEADGAPVPTEGAKGTLNVAGPGRSGQVVQLDPAGANKLTAKGLKPSAGDTLTARIKLRNGDEISSVFSFR